jgi:hypothetical protein
VSAVAVPIESEERLVWAARQKLLTGARNNFHKFTPLVVRDDQGAPIRYSHIHFQWIAHINYCWSRDLYAGIFAPFGHGKTSSLSVPLLAYLIGVDPQQRIKIICSGDNPSKLRMQAVKTIVETPIYGAVFPGIERGEKWNDHMMFVERRGHAVDPTIEARGVFTQGTGSRSTTLLFDDVVDIDNSSTHEKRIHVTKQVETLWISRLDDRPGRRARVLWIATPWDLEDASHAMRSRSDFCWLEQRVKEDLSGYESDVYNAGADYLAETTANIEEMVSDP